MPDPLARNRDAVPPLFAQTVPTSTSTIAGQQAARSVGSWRGRILNFLETRPATLWEIADHFHVPDHTISGRFSELQRDGFIERTGDRRPHPVSQCQADVWTIRRAKSDDQDAGDLLGYPLTIMIQGELYDRQPLLSREGYADIPYARRADTGGARLIVRLFMIECGECGRPLMQRTDGAKKTYTCGSGKCRIVYEAVLTSVPGGAPMMAMVARTF